MFAEHVPGDDILAVAQRIIMCVPFWRPLLGSKVCPFSDPAPGWMKRTDASVGRGKRPPAVAAAPTEAELIQTVQDFSDVLELSRDDFPGFVTHVHDEKHWIKMQTLKDDCSPIHLMKATARMPCSPRAFMQFLELDVRSQWDEYLHSAHVVAQVPGHPHTFFKYMRFRAPVPFLSHRDFELVACEKELPDGTMLLKSISTPRGMLVPPKERDGVVRGVVFLSGFVVKPVARGHERLSIPASSSAAQRSSSESCRECEATYIALIHPMGLIPSALVNVLIGKQTSGLIELQRFMSAHPHLGYSSTSQGAGAPLTPESETSANPPPAKAALRATRPSQEGLLAKL